MQALRLIVEVHNRSVNITLPDDFLAEKVEVIVLPVESTKEPHKLKNSERFSGAISKKTAQKLHQHLNEVRNEWQRDI